MICAHVESVYFKCLCLCTKDRKVRVRNMWSWSRVRRGVAHLWVLWLLGLGKDVMCVSVKGVPRWDDRLGQYSIKVSFCVLGLSCVTVWDLSGTLKIVILVSKISTLETDFFVWLIINLRG